MKLQQLLHCGGSTDRLTYQRNVALLAFGKAAIDFGTALIAPEAPLPTIALAWLDPFVLVKPWLSGIVPLSICISTFLFFSALVWNCVHRARHAGWPHWTGLISAFPFLGPFFAIVLAFVPPRKHSVWDLI